MGGEPRSRALLLVVAVVGSAPTVAGFGAGVGTRKMCDAVNLARSFGASLDEAMSEYVSSANLPAGCSLDDVFDQMCSDAGLACSDAFVVPSPINFASASANEITSYQQLVAELAACWDRDGALCPVSGCVSASDFAAMEQAMGTANTNIKSAITTVQTQLEGATGTQAADLQEELDALQLADTSTKNAEDVVTNAKNGACAGSSGGSSGGSSEDTSSTGGGDVDAGTIAGATVGGVVGVALIGYGLVQANVISFSAFSAAATTVSNVAPLVYSEEAEGFI